MSSVMVIASDFPLDAAASRAEGPAAFPEEKGSPVSVHFEYDFVVWPSDGYLEIPSKKKYFADLDIYNPNCEEKVAIYLKNLMEAVPELELWHVWLDGGMGRRVRTAEIEADSLTAEDIRELYTLETWREPITYYRYLIARH